MIDGNYCIGRDISEIKDSLKCKCTNKSDGATCGTARETTRFSAKSDFVKDYLLCVANMNYDF